jgi:hypothetical protein
VTAQGSSRSVFKRAIERGNLPMAEMAVREMGHVWLSDALKLTVLAIEKAPGKRNAYAVRFLRRLLEEDENLTIDEAVLAASALAALGGRGQEQAVSTLSGIAERASRQARNRPIAS